MMGKKSISIVAPAYNHEKYIEKCLWSVANQGIQHKELIIIDDVSKDSTPLIIKDIIKDSLFTSKFDLGVKFIEHEQNKGAFYSLNEGLKLAQGDFLTMINTDDYYDERRLELLLKECEAYGSEFAFGGVIVVDQNGNRVNSGYGKELMKYQDLIDKCPRVSMALTRGNGTISTGNMVFTKSLYEKLGGFGNYKYVHDWDFALRASLITEPVFVKNAIYYYRVHVGNTIAEISNNKSHPDTLEKPENGKTIGINPLVKHFVSILKNEYVNKMIPTECVWEYFVNHKKYYYDDDGIVWAWNEAKKIKEQ